MTVRTTIATPAQQHHRSLAVWAIALAALTIATVVAVFLTTGGDKGAGSASASSSPAPHTHYNSAAMASIMALTPARFAAGALGAGYALPTRQSGPTMAAVLASGRRDRLGEAQLLAPIC